jgi:hypothetical protein
MYGLQKSSLQTAPERAFKLWATQNEREYAMVEPNKVRGALAFSILLL